MPAAPAASAAIACAALAGPLAASSAAQEFAFTIDPFQSATDLDVTLTAAAAGTLIGDFDPTSNPGGTQTRPGIFGGSGNQPIDTTLSVAIDAVAMGVPAGSFTARFGDTIGDGIGNTIAVETELTALAADLLGGSAITAGLGVTLEYQTFRTVNPSFLYVGGFPLTLPLADAAIDALTLVQTGPAAFPAGLIPDGTGGFSLAGTVPVEITVTGEIGGGLLPASTLSETLAADLPIAGSLTFFETAAFFSFTITLDEIAEETDLGQLPPVEAIPLPLPTLSGEPANVLLSFAFDTLVAAGLGEFTLVARGRCAADRNADGILNAADAIDYITALASGDPTTDRTADGLTNAFDLLDFLAAFNAGCSVTIDPS